MNKTLNRAGTAFILATFAAYSLLLVSILVFKAEPPLTMLARRYSVRELNLVPWVELVKMVDEMGGLFSPFVFLNIFGNIAIFVPLGIFHQHCTHKPKKIIHTVMVAFAASLAVETLQYIFAIGIADVDDLILNTLGGFMGAVGYRLLHALLHSETRVGSWVATLGGTCTLIMYVFTLGLV